MITSKIEGRIRAQDAKLERETFTRTLCNKLKKLKGIDRVQPTALVGSILVEYDTDQISTPEVIDLLSDHIDCSEQSRQETKRLASTCSKSGSSQVGRKSSSGAGKGRAGGGRGQGMGRKSQTPSLIGDSASSLNTLLKNILPFTEGNTLISNAVKSLLSGAVGYQAIQFGRGRMGGGGQGRK